MTKIKLCGLRREADIEAVNILLPDYIGFVFAPGSKRYVLPAEAKKLKEKLDKRIKAVGVFVNEDLKTVAELLHNGTIDMAQLHGSEDEAYIRELSAAARKPVIKAFKITNNDDAKTAEMSTADYILYDSGAGTGKVFDWSWLDGIEREYFLAGGLSIENVSEAIKKLHPYAVDVSSGIETDGLKDEAKMKEFISNARGEALRFSQVPESRSDA